MRTIRVSKQMRMPLFSYFAVVGVTLTLALLFISDRIEPLGSPVPTSQAVGIAKPFTPELERSPTKSQERISQPHTSPRVQSKSRSPSAGLSRTGSNGPRPPT